RHLCPRLPFRRRALERARAFIAPRLNGEDGLGAIYPAMANAVMAFDALGYPRDHPDVVTARNAVRKLLVASSGERGGAPRSCQPCVSPVWDTALAAHGLLEAGVARDDPRLLAACDWLA